MLRAFSGFRCGLARGSDLLKHKFSAKKSKLLFGEQDKN